MQLDGLAFDCFAENPHDSLDLVGWTAPVFGRKGPEREVPDANLPGGECDGPDVVGSALVAGDAGQSSIRGPAPVAVHDDGDGARYPPARNVGQRTSQAIAVIGSVYGRGGSQPRSDLQDLVFFAFADLVRFVGETLGKFVELMCRPP